MASPHGLYLAPYPRQGNLRDQFPHLSSIPSRVGWLNARPLTAQQVSQRLREAGYDGDVRILKDCVHTIRPF